jgi:MFS family permease
MFGFVSLYLLFVAAVILITIGEMIVVPIGQALAANFAPEDMRGRYMAFFGLSWALPSTIGPWAAGLVMDNYDPRWVWYLGGIIATVAVVAFLWLHTTTRQRFVALESTAAPAD